MAKLKGARLCAEVIVGRHPIVVQSTRSLLPEAKASLAVMAFLLAFISLGAVTARPAAAAFNPCTTQSNYFEGWSTHYAKYQFNNNAFEGIAARPLVYRSINECTTQLGIQNRVSGWAMVESNNGRAVVQSGFIYWWGQCMAHFGEYFDLDHGLFTRNTGACVQPGETHQAWEQWRGDLGGLELANIDSTTMATLPENPFSTWALPMNIEVDGETNYPEDDAPGTATSVLDWQNLQVQLYDDNWYDTCGNAVFGLVPIPPSLHRYTAVEPSCHEIQAWTNNPNGY